jgi:hypothetical protein
MSSHRSSSIALALALTMLANVPLPQAPPPKAHDETRWNKAQQKRERKAAKRRKTRNGNG